MTDILESSRAYWSAIDVAAREAGYADDHRAAGAFRRGVSKYVWNNIPRFANHLRLAGTSTPWEGAETDGCEWAKDLLENNRGTARRRDVIASDGFPRAC